MSVAIREKLKIEPLEQGAVWRIVLNAPKGNVLDATMVGSLHEVFAEARTETRLKALLLTGEGAHFSFGAAVEEHRPAQVATMLQGFHAMFRALANTSLCTFAAVRGQCLGGGLELASFCSRVFAAPDAKLGQPEIRLGVFAPVASLVLPERLGLAAAEDLCLSGRVVAADEARTLGLVDEIAPDPEQRALEWFRQHLAPHSAASLRRAVSAVRRGFLERFDREIDELEAIYLGDLMRTHDAVEGIEAFLAKRPPAWRDA